MTLTLIAPASPVAVRRISSLKVSDLFRLTTDGNTYIYGGVFDVDGRCDVAIAIDVTQGCTATFEVSQLVLDAAGTLTMAGAPNVDTSEADRAVCRRLGAAMPLPSGLTMAEESLCAKSEKIQAIKSVRERTGLGLKEAKEKVDAACGTPTPDGRGGRW